MPLAWDDRKRLLRMHGIADELLTSARASSAPGSAKDALGRQVDAVAQEVHLLLLDTDDSAADEFQRIVLEGAGGESPPDVSAAVLVGWLKAGLAAETVEAQQHVEERKRSEQQPAGRKQSIGFKIRSAVTRQAPDASD